MLLAFAGVTSAASAQQYTVTEVDVIQVQDKYQVITNPFWSNWFMSIGGGASVLLGQGDNAGKFGDRISPTLNVSVGKWFTPGLGLRLQYSGLQAKGYSYNKDAPYVTGAASGDSYYKQKFDYMNFHGDVLFNLSALICGYNPDRVYEIIPYLGAGLVHNYTTPRHNSLGINAGIINRFRLSSAVDLNLELSALGTETKFDGEPVGSFGYDGVLSATVGLTYRFPCRGFDRPMPQLISEIELQTMRQMMNQMSADNSNLERQLTNAQNRPIAIVEEEDVVVDAKIAPRAVFFNIGSAVVSPREEMNIKFLADKMCEFPTMHYTVYGYADSATGSPAFNQELSLKRAQAVVDVLVNKFGIAADRLSADASGGVDTFGKPTYLNRVVLVNSANN